MAEPTSGFPKTWPNPPRTVSVDNQHSPDSKWNGGADSKGSGMRAMLAKYIPGKYARGVRRRRHDDITSSPEQTFHAIEVEGQEDKSAKSEPQDGLARARWPKDLSGPQNRASPILLHSSTPLERPSQQLRLLSFSRAATAIDIRCELTVHEIDKAPPYAALSYVWGHDADCPPIYINGLPFHVRPNCHNALSKVVENRETCPSDYYWIDSICINQNNPREKGPQVQMMGQIFTSAQRVISYIGAPDGDSEFLFSILSDLETQDSGQKHRGRSEIDWKVEAYLRAVWNSKWKRTAETNISSYEALLQRLTTALETFTKRDYWRRLWVVQEILLATNNRIYHGRFDVPMYIFSAILPHCDISRDIAPVIKSNMDNDINLRIDRTILQFSQFDCMDFRDRIYSLLQIIHWPNNASPDPLEPDYEITKLGLIMQVLKKLAPAMDRSDPLAANSYYIEIAAQLLEVLRDAFHMSFKEADIVEMIDTRLHKDSESWKELAESFVWVNSDENVTHVETAKVLLSHRLLKVSMLGGAWLHIAIDNVRGNRLMWSQQCDRGHWTAHLQVSGFTKTFRWFERNEENVALAILVMVSTYATPKVTSMSKYAPKNECRHPECLSVRRRA